MDMPKGWYTLQVYRNKANGEGKYTWMMKMDQALDIIKLMAEALEKVQAIAEMTMPNGTVAPTPLYNDVTPVLDKFKGWK